MCNPGPIFLEKDINVIHFLLPGDPEPDFYEYTKLIPYRKAIDRSIAHRIANSNVKSHPAKERRDWSGYSPSQYPVERGFSSGYAVNTAGDTDFQCG